MDYGERDRPRDSERSSRHHHRDVAEVEPSERSPHTRDRRNVYDKRERSRERDRERDRGRDKDYDRRTYERRHDRDDGRSSRAHHRDDYRDKRRRSREVSSDRAEYPVPLGESPHSTTKDTSLRSIDDEPKAKVITLTPSYSSTKFNLSHSERKWMSRPLCGTRVLRREKFEVAGKE